jgi:hypothetical protein
MEKFSAAHYFAIARALESGQDDEPYPDHRPELFTEGGDAWFVLTTILSHCEQIGLAVSIRCINEFLYKGQKGIEHSTVQELMRQLTNVIHWEMQEKTFMFLPPERASRYALVEPFGQEVHKSFSSIAFDTIEAGNCFASARFTACVFHLMRALELGLAAFAKLFGVPSDHTNWHNIIEGIESKIRNMGNDPNKDSDWKTKQEQYAQIANSFMFFKDAWRNYTAHVRGKYTEDEADSIYRNVRSFMQGLAKAGLQE